MRLRDHIELRILSDPQALGRAAAQAFRASARGAIAARGRFSVALSGGSTPEWLFRALLEEPRFGFDWSSVHVFWGDERAVSPDDPRSNFGAARRGLLDHVEIPAANLHRIRGEDPAPTRAAADYERELERFFEPPAGAPPRFDMIYLGMGADGHTASLFPHSQALDENRRWVVANPVAGLDTTRLTLTYPVLNAAGEVIFLVCGDDKAATLQAVLEGPFEPRRLPSQAVRPAAGALRRWVDAAAASALERR